MKIIKNILMISLAGLLSACGNDWLDRDPSTSVDTEGSLNTLRDYEFTLNGIYSTMQSYYYYGARMQYYGDVTGDDMQAYSSSKRCANYYQFTFNKDNAPSTFWRTCYDIIQNTNIVINQIDQMTYEGEDEEGQELFTAYQKDLKGQALAIRALALFDITRLYGYPYPKDNGASLGGAIVEEVVDIHYKPKRSTVAQCYEKVISYLNTAIPLLATQKEKSDEDWMAKSTKGKMNKWAAMTLLSRVYLYQGNNELAFQTAEEAIKGAEKDGYCLWTNEEYTQVWAKDFTSEVFFEIVNLLTDGPGKESIGYLCSDDGYRDIVLTSSFVKFLSQDKDDVRYKMFKIGYKKRAYVQKYPGQPGDGGPADANVPLFRMSELYLNAAEAAVKLNDNYNAVKYLNAIVQRGNPENTVEGTTVTVERVLDERRKEFYGEGHRMFDVLRNGGTIERTDASVSGLSTSHLTLLDYAKKFDWTMYKVVLPIPKAEIDANPNMKSQQNPGY